MASSSQMQPAAKWSAPPPEPPLWMQHSNDRLEDARAKRPRVATVSKAAPRSPPPKRWGPARPVPHGSEADLAALQTYRRGAEGLVCTSFEGPGNTVVVDGRPVQALLPIWRVFVGGLQFLCFHGAWCVRPFVRCVSRSS
jgi:hypothetical protein